MKKHLNITNRTFATLALSLVAIAGLGLSCTCANAVAAVPGLISDEAPHLTEYRWIGSAIVSEPFTGAELTLTERGTVLAANRIEARLLAAEAMKQKANEHGKILRLAVELTGANT